MDENYSFDLQYLNKIADLIILSTKTENNNLRQTYFFELLELGNNTNYLIIHNFNKRWIQSK